jgi:hypothetical protein
MTDPEFDVAVDPLGTTTGGLPYPETSAPLNQGANDIKALALALEGRGLGYKSARGYLNAASFNGGRYSIVLPAGFTTCIGCIVTGHWGGTTGNNASPLVISVETMTAAAVGLIALMPPQVGQAGTASAWFTGTSGLSWLAWGT